MEKGWKSAVPALSFDTKHDDRKKNMNFLSAVLQFHSLDKDKDREAKKG